MAKKPTIVEGQTFTDSTGAIVTVVKYESATKVHVQWSDGNVQTKSAQQLRSGNFSQRTRKGKGGGVESIEQPYKRLQEEAKELHENKEPTVYKQEISPSLFDNMEPDESYKDSDED